MAKGGNKGGGGGLRKLHLVKDNDKKDWALKPEGGGREVEGVGRDRDGFPGRRTASADRASRNR